jgi:hypothetical protein
MCDNRSVQTQGKRWSVMTRTLSVSILIGALIACSTNPYASDPKGSVAELSIRSIRPASGTTLVDASVLQAEIGYTITGFDAASEYYVAPLFDSNKGEGHTFNEFERLTDGWRVTTPSGSIQVSYPVGRELRSAQLARPVRVKFYVMVRTGAHKTAVIGKSETLEYGPAH